MRSFLSPLNQDTFNVCTKGQREWRAVLHAATLAQCKVLRTAAAAAANTFRPKCHIKSDRFSHSSLLKKIFSRVIQEIL